MFVVLLVAVDTAAFPVLFVSALAMPDPPITSVRPTANAATFRMIFRFMLVTLLRIDWPNFGLPPTLSCGGLSDMGDSLAIEPVFPSDEESDSTSPTNRANFVLPKAKLDAVKWL